MSKLFKVLKVALAITFVVVLAGVYRPVSAQAVSARGDGTPAPTFAEVTTDSDALPPAVATSHVLKHTYINSGETEGTAYSAETYTPIDKKLTVVCPAGPCTISAAMLVQAGESTTSSNLTRVCLYVDGVPGPNCLFFAGETTTDGEFTNSVQFDTVSGLATGHHTVQMYLWSVSGGAYGHWQATYNVYEP